jgi:DivIVA domain-containing protein
MIDLTPLDVRKKRGDFKRGLRGYDPEDVDGFLELVAERFEVLVRENLTLAERAERLEEQVRSQEGREKAVNDALVTAQQLREDISGQARREADTIRGNAEAEAKAMVDRARVDAGMVRREVEKEIDAALREARRRLEEAQEALENLERNRARFLKSFRTLLEREMDGVEVEEGRSALDLPTIDLELLGGQTGEELMEARIELAPGGVSDLEEEAPEEFGTEEFGREAVDEGADPTDEAEVSLDDAVDAASDDGGAGWDGDEVPDPEAFFAAASDSGEDAPDSDGDPDPSVEERFAADPGGEDGASAIAGQLEDLFGAPEAEGGSAEVEEAVDGESDFDETEDEDPDRAGGRAGFRFENDDEEQG